MGQRYEAEGGEEKEGRHDHRHKQQQQQAKEEAGEGNKDDNADGGGGGGGEGEDEDDEAVELVKAEAPPGDVIAEVSKPPPSGDWDYSVTVEEVLRLDTVRHQSAAELRREKIRAAKAREVRLIDGSIE